MTSDDPDLQALAEKLAAAAVPATAKGYARFFDQSAPDLMDQPVLTLDVEHLPVELRWVLVTWVKRQADLAEAKAKLKALLPGILFDIEAAERGALPPHRV